MRQKYNHPNHQLNHTDRTQFMKKERKNSLLLQDNNTNENRKKKILCVKKKKKALRRQREREEWRERDARFNYMDALIEYIQIPGILHVLQLQ